MAEITNLGLPGALVAGVVGQVRVCVVLHRLAGGQDL